VGRRFAPRARGAKRNQLAAAGAVPQYGTSFSTLRIRVRATSLCSPATATYWGRCVHRGRAAKSQAEQ